MRKSSNVRSAIVAPEFTNVKLYNYGYKVSISLPISESVYHMLGSSCSKVAIQWRGKYYIHWEKSYDYDTAFSYAFGDAYESLKHMKIAVREAKMQILQCEIEMIKYE